MLGNYADQFFAGHARERVVATKPNSRLGYNPPDQDRVSDFILPADNGMMPSMGDAEADILPGMGAIRARGMLPSMGSTDAYGMLPSMGNVDAYGMLPSMGDLLPPTAVASMKEPKNLMIAAAIGLGLFMMLRK